MGTSLIGRVTLANGQVVFITSMAHPIQSSLRAQIEKLRKVRVFDSMTGEIKAGGMLAFGTEPNPDADDGTRVGILMAISRHRATGHGNHANT